MTLAETIHQKIDVLPLEAQRKILEAVKEIEKNYKPVTEPVKKNEKNTHPLALLSEIQIDFENAVVRSDDGGRRC